MNTSYGKQFYLHIPASNAEKFISKWLQTGIGYFLVFTLIYFLFSFIANALGKAFFNFDHGTFNLFTKDNTLYIQTVGILVSLQLSKPTF